MQSSSPHVCQWQGRLKVEGGVEAGPGGAACGQVALREPWASQSLACPAALGQVAVGVASHPACADGPASGIVRSSTNAGRKGDAAGATACVRQEHMHVTQAATDLTGICLGPMLGFAAESTIAHARQSAHAEPRDAVLQVVYITSPWLLQFLIASTVAHATVDALSAITSTGTQALPRQTQSGSSTPPSALPEIQLQPAPALSPSQKLLPTPALPPRHDCQS